MKLLEMEPKLALLDSSKMLKSQFMIRLSKNSEELKLSFLSQPLERDL